MREIIWPERQNGRIKRTAGARRTAALAAGARFGVLLLALAVSFCMPARGLAIGSQQNPQSGSTGLQGTISAAPPTTAATISTPTSGQTFTSTPITVSGLCPSGLLVKIFSNNVFVGSVVCAGGSYSLQVDLFDGRNDLVARVFDALDQPGPDSNVVTVTFNDRQFANSGVQLLSLTSNYALRGANPGELLTWPVTISGGTAPYALSVDWGDNKPPSLQVSPFAGSVDLTHVYDSAGIYTIIVKATDKNGMTAYLQLVGQANGAVTQSAAGSAGGGPNKSTPAPGISFVTALLIALAVALFCSLVSFWLGRGYALTSLRRRLERQRSFE